MLGPFEFSFDAERAAAFVASTGGAETPDFGGTLPPSAVVAEGLARLIAELDLFGDEILAAGGVVHTSQEAEFFSPVSVGQKVSATAKIAGNTLRRGTRFVSVFTEFRNESHEIVATASSTIVVPK